MNDPVAPQTARALLRDLRSLADVEAPARLGDATLVAVGLADGYTQFQTPVGPLYVAYNLRGISAVTLSEDDTAFERNFQERFDRQARRVAALPPALARPVEAAIRGERHAGLTFDLSSVSEFERKVLLKALEIPRGEVRPYAWIAREIGHPKAVRAVGTALAKNPIPLFIPCHRVVRSDGHLGRYSLGSDAMKGKLLAYEGLDPVEVETLAARGIRYVGSDTTHIYCFPTCHHAQRITSRHRIAFTSTDEAARAGYRPCSACRPATAAS